MSIMLDVTTELLRYVFIEASAQGDVNHLATTTDPEERLAKLDQYLNQVDLHTVTIGIHSFDFWMGVIAILAGVDIISTGEEDAIQPEQEQIKIFIG
jgi:hypothetical protein